MTNQDVVIVAAKRTPMGSFQGVYKSVSTIDLGACVIDAVIQTTGVEKTSVDEVIMGCVLPAGLGQAPARQASIRSGLPDKVYCSTINKVCGSGLKAVMLAADQIAMGHSQIVVAGGMENMTMGPYLLMKGRSGYRYGHDVIIDHTLMDGLEDPYHKRAMGTFAEDTALRYNFSREDQDEFATTSGKRAIAATKSGYFHNEIAPVTYKERGQDIVVNEDEQLGKLNFEKMKSLKSAFREGGTVTAANSSPLTDGAAALMLMTASKAAELGLTPMARIVAQASHSREPEWFTLAPIKAIEKLFHKTGWKAEDVDLFEINEAFAVVTMAAMKDLNLDHNKVNIHGGACALGHPIGGSGARILTTLLHALQRTGGKKGVAAICIGGGEGLSLAVEMI
ncbi:MAG: thiolase family protein [Alphaproteobacteria bacterium]|nr:thiolase family protein [Alphaproteobacteria bacterium]